MEDAEEDGHISPTSSPPTPPSPLPISTGPGNQKYYFSPSPTPSPPFSPPQSSHTSAENLPLLHESSGPTRAPPLAFSLDRKQPDEAEDSRSSCLKDLQFSAGSLQPPVKPSYLSRETRTEGKYASSEIFRAGSGAQIVILPVGSATRALGLLSLANKLEWFVRRCCNCYIES